MVDPWLGACEWLWAPGIHPGTIGPCRSSVGTLAIGAGAGLCSGGAPASAGYQISFGSLSPAWERFGVGKIIDSWPFVIALAVLAWFIFTWDGASPGGQDDGSGESGETGHEPADIPHLAKPFVFEEPRSMEDAANLILRLGDRLVAGLDAAKEEESARLVAADLETLLPAFASLRNFSNPPPDFERVWGERIGKSEEAVGQATNSALENAAVARILEPVLKRLEDVTPD